MSRRKPVVSRNQAFSRFLPGAIETIDGETVHVNIHELTGADIDAYTKGFLQNQVRSALLQWPHIDAVYKPFLEDAENRAFEFVTSTRLIARALPVVECRKCYAVTNAHIDRGEDKRCRRPQCRGSLRVLPFIEIHSCGLESEVRIPKCTEHGDQYIKMERHAQRRWACGMPACDWTEGAWANFCGKNCYLSMLQVPLPKDKKRRSQVLVGSNSVFRTQSIDILNPPTGELGRLFRSFPEYVPALFVSEYLGLQSIDFTNLEPLFQVLNELKNEQGSDQTSRPSLDTVIAGLSISGEQREALVAALSRATGQTQTAKRVAEFRASLDRVNEMVPELASDTVPWSVLKEANDLCLALNLPNSTNLEELVRRLSGRGGAAALSALDISSTRSRLPDYGLEDISLITNFPIVSCAYGFTRGFLADEKVLRSFPKRPSVTGGSSQKTPFYVLSTGTEALVVRISPAAALRFLESNGFSPPALEDDALRRAWILRQFMGEDVRLNPKANPAAYALFAVVHSYAHRMIEQVALESCFRTTSLSEMVMPAALGFIIYVNQRSEFNIGGLSSFVEQRLSRALSAIVQPTPCMFDPICTMKDGGACNGCLFLPEVTCREFNTGLTRTVLHGGDIQAQHELASIMGARHITGFFSAGK